MWFNSYIEYKRTKERAQQNKSILFHGEDRMVVTRGKELSG